jgi:hypothetical protein
LRPERYSSSSSPWARRVLRLDMQPEEPPLIFYRGGYGRFETAEVRSGSRTAAIAAPAATGSPSSAPTAAATFRPSRPAACSLAR